MQPNDNDKVPGDKKIRTRSLPHVSTERLKRRLAWFHETDHRPFLAALENRRPMRDLAREIINVQYELSKRISQSPETPEGRARMVPACFACGKQLEHVDANNGGTTDHNQPYEASVLRCHGHYGDTVFDPMDGSYLELNVCSDCMTQAAAAGRVLIGREARPVKVICHIPRLVTDASGKYYNDENQLVEIYSIWGWEKFRSGPEVWDPSQNTFDRDYRVMTLDEVAAEKDNPDFQWNLGDDLDKSLKSAIAARTKYEEQQGGSISNEQ